MCRCRAGGQRRHGGSRPASAGRTGRDTTATPAGFTPARSARHGGRQEVGPGCSPAAADRRRQAAARQAQGQNGFKIELYAAGVPNARTLRLGDKGTVFVSSRLQDKVHAIVEKDGKREVKVIASGLHRPNGIVLHKGTLYIAELSQISKIDNIEDNLDNPPKPTVILGDLPKDEPHGWKYLTVGPDEKLYFHVGAPCNICMPLRTARQDLSRRARRQRS